MAWRWRCSSSAICKMRAAAPGTMRSKPSRAAGGGTGPNHCCDAATTRLSAGSVGFFSLEFLDCDTEVAPDLAPIAAQRVEIASLMDAWGKRAQISRGEKPRAHAKRHGGHDARQARRIHALKLIT